MKHFSLVFLFSLLCTCLGVQAQTSGIEGNLKDSVNFRPMAYSAAVLIRSRDSVLIRHQWVGENDAFGFSQLPADTYDLYITRPGYADYEDHLILKEHETKQLGSIFLVSKSNLLREAIIRERTEAIRIKGDTTEFLVDSFLSNKNANVEDLLKRLPGLQVDKDGKITAQGQEVKKVLVDGEEFFGDDPTVATRNLRADNVDKVQVFDKKSDQAAFSGIDDGVKEKTINLQLKESAKKGYFGKVSAGGGTGSRYQHDAMANLFRNKRKFSVYGAASNTNKTRLSWEEANKYGGGSDNNYEYDENSGFMYSYMSGDNMDYNGVGVPQTWYTGLFFADKLDQDKHSYSINANKKDLSTSGFDNYFSTYILPDTLYYVNQLKDVRAHRQQNALSGNYEWKADSFTTWKFKSSFKNGNNNSVSITNSSNLNENNDLVFNNHRTNTQNGSNYAFNNSLSWNRKFRTTGRSLMMQLGINGSGAEGDGYLQSKVDLYDSSGAVTNSTSIDQKKLNRTQTQSYTGKLTYTEPITKVWFAVMDYDASASVNDATRTTLAKTNGEYSAFVDSLSNDLDYFTLVNKGGLAIRYVTKKVNFNVGGRISHTDLRQRGNIAQLNQSREFLNIFPSAGFNLRMSTTSSMNFGYNGSTRQPSMQQIQPVQDNSNPLDVYVGNQQLGQSFSNSFNFFYNTYKPLTGRSFYTSFAYTFINNDFTSLDQVDSYGRKIHQTINVNGNNSFWGVAYYYFSIKKLNLRLGSNINPYTRTQINYINGIRNVNKSYNFSFGQNISYELEKKLDITLTGDWNLIRGTSSLRPDVVSQSWLHEYSLHGEWQLPSKFSLRVSANYNVRQRTSDFDRNVNTLIVNGGIEKRFLKSESLVAKIEVYDMFNQNLGFDRNVSSNYISEHIYSVLRQYFLFTLQWNFTNGPVEKDED